MAAAPRTERGRRQLPVALRFRSFRTRLLIFVLGLLLLVQAAVFAAVTTANVRNARQHVDEALALTAAAFDRSLAVRERILLEKARLLSSDFAFKEVCAAGDVATLLSALENHRDRVGASVMMVVSMDGRIEADTLHREAHGRPFSLPHLLEAARGDEFGEASSIEFLGAAPHQLVVTPLFTPEPSAWIVIGFAVDDALARELRQGTGTHVSLLRRTDGGGWQPFASTLPDDVRRFLGPGLSQDLHEANRSLSMDLGGAEYVSWVAPARSVGAVRVVTVLQRSLEAALAPYMRLRTVLAAVFGGGLLLSVVGGALLAGRVTRPVAVLAAGAERVTQGDYTQPVEVDQQDELGLLADAFNRMTRGLAERDRVRSLLGKVVSPAVAEELLSKEIELGGEERVASVLFSDIRNFTSISERVAPQELVRLLNTYLTRVSAIVEQHGGVVDKYIGDAVMAVFGAPLAHPDDASRAVRAALDMCAALGEINAELGLAGAGRLGIGVGVSTGVVVAGNMGSLSRLNYTVIGDSVNVASRLEGLTKRYGVGVVVGEATREACPGIAFRELDRVRVKGRETPLGIFEPLGAEDALAADLVEELAWHREALERFRARSWDAALGLFRRLEARRPEVRLYALYRKRVEAFLADPPAADWDGATTYEEK